MRHLVSCLLAFIVPTIMACTAAAQPTLTSGTYSPVPGELFTGTSMGLSWPGPGGAGQTWDFSNLVGAAGGLNNYVDPVITLGGALFPTATVANQYPGFDNAFYYEATSAGYSELGFYAPPSNVRSCSDPILLMSYPLTFGSSYTDGFSCSETGGVYDVVRYGTITMTADAYGTLILPYGTFTDCLRLHEVRDFIDAFSSLPDSGFVTRDYYHFVRPGIHASLLTMGTQVYTQGTSTIISEGTTMLDPLSTWIDPVGGAAGLMLLAPNPATDRVELFVPSGDVTAVELCDATGRTLRSWTIRAGAQHAVLDLSGLPCGVHVVRIVRADGSAEVQRLLKG
ncbi:MAG: hypothetical protein IPG69_17610 [Flavobacteriales bacterium]|nr:hypothetical protein [Flavobacteriales bacterium]